MTLTANSSGTLTLTAKVSLALFMSLLAFAIMLGNAVVILAFVVDKNLRHRSNYFLLNLAISDFFVGAISIPLYIPHTVFSWDFGSEICTFWLIIDYLLCTASVYNIVLISYDRYQSVSNAVSYRTKHTGSVKIVAQMAAVWILAFLVNGPMILASNSWKNSTDTNECEPGFVTKWYILAITTFLEFLVPVISVAYFNVQIYWSLWKRGSLNRCCSHVGFIPTSSSDSGHLPRARGVSRTPLPASKESATSLHSKCPRRKSSLLVSLRTHMNSNVFKVGSFSQSEASAFHRKEYMELLRGRKLARSLAILLGAFAICWAPYCLSTIVLSIYPRGERSKSVWYTIAFWLQWFNSFVNPFLYPLCHRSFQKAFWKIFRVKRQHTPSQNQSISS
nr:histamine H4 receptor isoform X1 [Myodes glareolus]